MSVAVNATTGHPVEVLADITDGLPEFTLLGLPGAWLSEARDRVRAALANSGHPLPARRISVTLSPPGLSKLGTGFDLAIAVELLRAADVVPDIGSRPYVYLGELGLDGSVRPVRGVFAAVLAAVEAGHRDIVVAEQNATEARLVPAARVHAVRALADVVTLHDRDRPQPQETPGGVNPPSTTSFGASTRPGGGTPDMADVPADHPGRWPVEVAAAGGHHLLLIGPPGAGKTLLAARLPGLLPDLSDPQAVEVTAIHSVAGTLDPAAGLIRRPPFESPHHTATVVSLMGGGSGLPHPGSASRAHRGVLFLDEAAEFDAQVLDCLRQPLEQGELVIHRARGSVVFAARFQLVLATNPCPSGLAHGAGLDCTCVPSARRRYLARLSGPLLDRVDLQVDLQALPGAASGSSPTTRRRPETTATIAARVAAARAAQQERLAGTAWSCNGEIPGTLLRGDLLLPAAVTAEADTALKRAHLSIRGYDQVLRAGWSVADLRGHQRPDRDDIGEAMRLRTRGAPQ